MILEKNVSMIFPSLELGRKIASEDCRTQCQVLEGFATKQLMKATYNSQALISLVALLPPGAILWFVKIYQEIVKQKKVPRELNDLMRKLEESGKTGPGTGCSP